MLIGATQRRPRLFVHVGPAKTGTSAVQHALREHDGSVVLYPKVGLWPDGAHHNLVFNYFGDTSRPETVPENPATMCDRIAEQARATHNSVVISSEALASARAGTFIGALGNAMNVSPGDIEIIVVCREHFGRAASLYSQRIKDAAVLERRRPGDFLRSSAERLCQARLLRRLEGLGYRLHVMNYHPAESFLTRFLAHVGFPADRPADSALRNVSLSVRGMIALLAANRVAASPADRRRLAAAMRGLKDRFRSPGFIFDAASATAVQPVFAADREILRQEWQVDLPAIDLKHQTDGFVVCDADISDIKAACRGWGSDGNAIVDYALEYIAHGR